MKLIKSQPLSEMQKLINKFRGKKKNYRIECDSSGIIISLETKDKEIINFAKDLGLKES